MMFDYYIGDLCYVLGETEWETACAYLDGDPDDEFCLSPENDGNPRTFACLPTAYGDGVYFDQNGNEYSVDSGTIGMINVRFITEGAKLENALANGWGHVHSFEEEIDSSECVSDGRYLTFGAMSVKGIEIDTGE
jgi:hypothetical protein